MQLQQDVDEVIQINAYTMNIDDVDQFLKTWTSLIEIARRSILGVISTQILAFPTKLSEHQNIQGTLLHLTSPCLSKGAGIPTIRLG